MCTQFGSGRFEVLWCAHVKVMVRLIGKMAVVERAKPTEHKQSKAKDKRMFKINVLYVNRALPLVLQ